MIGILFVAVVHGIMIPHLGKPQGWNPKTYQIQIGASPRQIWQQPVLDHKQQLDHFLQEFDKLKISQEFFKYTEFWAKNIFTYQQMVKEVQAIAQIGNYDFGKLFFLNFMYQFSTIPACSSILVRNSQGKILHGRNLDFQMMRLLSPLVVKLQFYSGSKHIYSMNSIVGSVFALTGQRHGAFAISVDTRKGKNTLQLLTQVFWNGAFPSTWLVRKTLQQTQTFEKAVHRLNTTIITGPVYYIISGLQGNQGVVIQRQQQKAHGFYQLDDQKWFLVQTNYDRDIPDPPRDYRRIPAQKRLQMVGKKLINKDSLYEVMRQWPTFNIGTIYTVIMQPFTTYNNLTVWYGANKHKQSKQPKQSK